MGSQQSHQPSESENMSRREQAEGREAAIATVPSKASEDDDEPDEWDKRIFSTGCADENAKMTDCYFEKKDWRACAAEMDQFKQCWKRHGNETRTDSKDA